MDNKSLRTSLGFFGKSSRALLTTAATAALLYSVTSMTTSSRALADDAAPAASSDAPAAPAAWADTFKIYAQAEVSASGTTGSNSGSDINFGHLFDDRTDTILLNQLLLTATRPTDPAATDYDYGFKLQGMYGSDARYVRAPHEFSGVLSDDLNQFALVEANAQVHTPWLTDGGVDWKIGRMPTAIGFEVIDASANPFFSHSYIFNFGIPLESTGVLATWHSSALLDIYAGTDTGVNTSLDHGLLHAQNGAAPGINAGLGLNLLGGNLTILGLTHAGAETPNGVFPATVNVKSGYRYLNDIVTTWKYSDTLTLVNELNWIHDDIANAGSAADGYGTAVYATYTLTDTVSLSGRGEVFRDAEGVFVGQFGGYSDFIRAEEGLPVLSSQTTFPGAATYDEVTFGATMKPTDIKILTGLMLRGEVRYDGTIGGSTHPFGGKNTSEVTGALDVILTY